MNRTIVSHPAPFKDNLTHQRKVTNVDARRFMPQIAKTSTTIESEGWYDRCFYSHQSDYDNCFREFPNNMLHAKSLRVIGQAVEAARVATFEVEKYGPQYMLWTDSVTEAGEWILRNALGNNVISDSARHRTANRVFCFDPADISRLDAQAQRKRKNSSFSDMPAAKSCSHALRSLGDHLDRMQINAFRIEWTVGSVILDYQRAGGQRTCRTFTSEEMRELCVHPRLRRAGHNLFPKLEI